MTTLETQPSNRNQIADQIMARLLVDRNAITAKAEKTYRELQTKISVEYSKVNRRDFMLQRVIKNAALVRELTDLEVMLHSSYNSPMTCDKDIQAGAELTWVTDSHLKGDRAYDFLQSLIKRRRDLTDRVAGSQKYSLAKEMLNRKPSIKQGYELLPDLLANRKINEATYNSIVAGTHPEVMAEIEILDKIEGML